MHRVARVEPAALLEREHEVERIRAALNAVGQNAGGALVIEGAAGVGKSRLLEESRVAAADLGLGVLNARATELEQDEARVRGGSSGALGARRGRQVSRLGSVKGVWVRVLGVLVGPAGSRRRR
jgi:hypothetical protein